MILFPPWPTPRELERMTPSGRAKWGLLMILQTGGMILAAMTILFT